MNRSTPEPMSSVLPISSAPRDGTAFGALQRPRRSSGSRSFIGWWAYHEPVPLIRHDASGWEPIEDQAAARAEPIEKVRQPVAHAVVVGAAKAPHRSAAPLRRCVRRPALVVGL